MTRTKSMRDKGRQPVSERLHLKFRVRWRHVLLIDQEIRSGKAPNCRRLAEALEVNRRTILRDIDFMRYDLGAPVEYSAARRGYVYTEPNWNMPSLRITEGELFALMVAEKALENYAGTPWADKLQRVFDRMVAALPDRIEIEPRELLTRVTFGTDAPAIVDPDILATLTAALRENRTVQMRYSPLGADEVRQYVLDPYILRRAQGAWYVAGRDHRTGHVPLFNLSRVRAVEPTAETFDYEAAGFDPAKYFGATFGVYEAPQRHRVVIEFSGVAAQLVCERQWHVSQKLKDLPCGRLRFEAAVSHLDDVWPWVLSWGCMARVVAPPELVQIVAQEATQAAKQYRKGRGT